MESNKDLTGGFPEPGTIPTMTKEEKQAREILGDLIQEDGKLLSKFGETFVNWEKQKTAALIGDFTADQLDAISFWMRNKGGK